jgi:membrane protein
MQHINSSFFKELWNRIDKHDVTGMAAQLAYFFLLSLFPFLIFLMTLLPYVPMRQEDILGVVRDFAPGETMSLIETSLEEIMNKNSKLLSFGLIATLWTASNGIHSIVSAFNRAYDVIENRSYIYSRLMSVLLTVGMIFVIVVALLLPVFGRHIGTYLFSEFGMSKQFLDVWNALRWLISSCILFIVFTGLYWIAPNKKLTCVSATPGALFATVGWALTSLAFSYYVGNFDNYTATYGGIGAIIVLMTWFYLSGFIIITGGEINAYLTSKKPGCT